MPMQYELQLTETVSGAGFFACVPAEDRMFSEWLDYLRAHPNDEFIHKHLLSIIAVLNADRVQHMIEAAMPDDEVVLALLYEACLSYDKFFGLQNHFQNPAALSEHTPLIQISSHFLGDQAIHSQWIRIFAQNILGHQPLPSPDATDLPLLFPEADTGPALVRLQDIYEDMAGKEFPKAAPRPSLEETAQTALERLESVGVISGEEMRHVASLSPNALLREWRVRLSVKNGQHDYSFSGPQTSYGRGLSIESARAAYLMEMVERCSSFASVGEEGILNYTSEYPLRYARYGELLEENTSALNLNHLLLETPYEDNKPLYWMEAEEQGKDGHQPILIPAQCVFLFCNLDEVALFSGLGSTGLASGNTLTEAKVSALLEVIERDAESTTFYDPGKCFRLEADDPQVAALLADYREKGIHIQFQDMSSFGLPCYKCFVIGPQGQIIKGTGAHLNGRRAVLSAMTETTYPYPHGPASRPGPEGLPSVRFEDLSNYSLDNMNQNLAILEGLLLSNGYSPIYVNLTRRDLDIPVVRAIVPGLELMADFDHFSRVSPRLFSNYRVRTFP